MHRALQVEEAHAMAWAWVVARQLLLLFESDVVVARAALGCERATDAESDAATLTLTLTSRSTGSAGAATRPVACWAAAWSTA